MFKKMFAYLLAVLIVVSTPIQARVTSQKIEDRQNAAGRVETWASSSPIGASILAIFTAPDGAKVIVRVQQGFLQMTLPTSSMTVADDGGDFVFVSRTVPGSSSVEVFSRQEVNTSNTALQAKRFSEQALRSSGLPATDASLLAKLQEFLDIEGPKTKMSMSGSCWFDLALNYAGTFIAIGVCVVTGGLACAGGIIATLAMWNAFQRDCGVDANYGLPREK
jgi:hypothetical protein